MERINNIGFEDTSTLKIKGQIHNFPITSTGRILNHKIYSALVFFLENKQIRVIGSQKPLPYILHPKTVAVLQEKLSIEDVRNLENSILQDAESSSKFEVLRDVPFYLYRELIREDEVCLIDEHRIIRLPDSIENASVCKALEKEFSRAQILSCEGFVKKQIRDEKGITHSLIRLDIDDKIIRKGFMMPIFKQGLITGLKVYRFAEDERPFVLRSRK